MKLCIWRHYKCFITLQCCSAKLQRNWKRECEHKKNYSISFFVCAWILFFPFQWSLPNARATISLNLHSFESTQTDSFHFKLTYLVPVECSYFIWNRTENPFRAKNQEFFEFLMEKCSKVLLFIEWIIRMEKALDIFPNGNHQKVTTHRSMYNVHWWCKYIYRILCENANDNFSFHPFACRFSHCGVEKKRTFPHQIVSELWESCLRNDMRHVNMSRPTKYEL